MNYVFFGYRNIHNPNPVVSWLAKRVTGIETKAKVTIALGYNFEVDYLDSWTNKSKDMVGAILK